MNSASDQSLLTELRGLGFSEKESRVYLAAVKLGTTTMQKIAKMSGVNRATTYVLVEAMMKRGLMSSVTKGKKRYFSIESPEKLHSILEQEKAQVREKEKMINAVIPQLSEIFAATHGQNKPQVRFYEGKSGLLAVRDEVLKSKEKVAYALFHRDKIQEIFNEDERKSFSDKRIKKGIQVNAIYTSQEGPVLRDNKKDKTDYTFIPNTLYNSAIDITVFDYKLVITSLQEPLLSVLIESQDIADSFKQLFELLKTIPGADSVAQKVKK